MERNMKDIVKQLTLEEKAQLCSGASFWRTQPIDRLGIPSIMLTDGPHGLRTQTELTDHLGIHESIPAICFPSAVGMASSWNRELVRTIGEALGEEAQAEGVGVLLGPGANIKRSPLCGRNFEYFSEDPYLTGELAAAHINGVQSQGVGTSIKHFAANNQEHRRMSANSILDERTLREIYLTGFEIAVKKAEPWTVMAAYNQLNGTYCAENETLLTAILRDEWGHEGIVVSDWGAVNNAVASVTAGLELEMPPNNGISEAQIVTAVQNGELLEAKLDQAVERLLHIVFKAYDNQKENAVYDKESHHQLAREVARESMVLLKNDDQLLPLKKDGKVAVIGSMAKQVRIQGGGSSHVNATRVDDVLLELGKKLDDEQLLVYAEGYSLEQEAGDNTLIEDAKRVAQAAEVAVIFAGLPERYESEGYDREHLDMPANQVELIEQIAAVQPNVVVVLSNGAPIVMPWLGKVKSVLEAYLGGQAFGGAVADLLFGDVNPSGKLAETFPQSVKQSSAYPYFPGEGDVVEYREGILVGYRYFDTKEIEPLFPFGHGLSYTTFQYSDIKLSKEQISEQETVEVSLKVKNIGQLAGQEVVQLYVRAKDSTVIRPDKELKGFAKVALQPGEETTIQLTLDKRSFAYYNTELKDWHVVSGQYEVLVGASSRDIRLSATLHVSSTVVLAAVFHRNSTFGDMLAHPKAAPIVKQFMSMFASSAGNEGGAGISEEMRAEMAKDMLIRQLITFSGGKFTEQHMNKFLEQLNQAVKP